MELLGDKNWWLPGWLDRLLPNIDVEGTVDDELPVDEPPSPEAPPQDRTPELIG
jgi:RND superfamily putative drug exporter